MLADAQRASASRRRSRRSSGASRSPGRASRCTGPRGASTSTRCDGDRDRDRGARRARRRDRAWRAHTWSCSDLLWSEGRLHETSEAATRAAEHARRAGNRREVGWALGQIALCAIHGPMPVAEGLRWLERLLEAEPENRTLDANLSGFVTMLEAMSGRFDEARAAHRGEPRTRARPGPDLAGGRPGAAQRIHRVARR